MEKTTDGHLSGEHGPEQMGQVIELNPKKIYTIFEVDNILPLVRRITQEYVNRVQGLMGKFELAKSVQDSKITSIEREINECVQLWQNKMEKLGLKAKGLWIADFDSGDGYFCWKYPEEQVNYWHQYNNGFGGRVKIDRESLKQGLSPSSKIILPEQEPQAPANPNQDASPSL
ncbi:MAG: DUF2203 family protein [Bdellovibrionales bacterium]